MRYVIYMYTNQFNGKVYIGRTSNETRRKYEHKCAYGGCTRFHNAIKKWGYIHFDYKVLYEGDGSDEETAMMEKKFVEEYDATNPEKGYNTYKGGKVAPNLKLHSKHLSESLKGHKMSIEAREKSSNSHEKTAVYVDDIYFKSIKAAAEHFGFDKRCLAYCLKHNATRCYKGHKIRYENECK